MRKIFLYESFENNWKTIMHLLVAVNRMNRSLKSNGIYEPLSRIRYLLQSIHLCSGVMILMKKQIPSLMERFGINAVLNAGAIKWNDKYLLMPRVEGS